MNLTKLPFLEIIEWLDEDPQTMMWKFPDNDREIKNGARLIVRESQSALLLNEGKIADTFGAGTHPLSTENIPILTRLKGWQYGFKSPFKVDIYYFSIKQFVNLKWGTPAPIMMQDPHFGQVRVRGFGTYNVRIVQPASFFQQYAGNTPVIAIQDFERKLRDFIAPKFGEVIASGGISVLDIFKNLSAINDKIGPLIRQYFEPFGIEITQFTMTSATLPDEVNKYYDAVTGMNMIADMERFRQFNTAEAIGQTGSALHQATQQGVGIGLIMDPLTWRDQTVSKAEPRPVVEEPTATTTPATSPASSPASPSISSAPLMPETQTQTDIAAQLQTIKSLFEQGLIDESEFKAKKAEILAKI